jgi:hypothetical protein
MVNILMKPAIFLGIIITALMFMASCNGPAEIETPPDAVCRSIVNEKCVKCHYKTRICHALGTKSLGDWHKTINFMLKQGAQLNQDEKNEVIACLSSLPKESAVVCD